MYNYLLFGANPAPTVVLGDQTVIYLPAAFGRFVMSATPIDSTATVEQTGEIKTSRLGLRIEASIEYSHVNTAIMGGVEVPGFEAFAKIQEQSSFSFSKTGRNPLIEMRMVGTLDLTRVRTHVPEGVRATFESLLPYPSLRDLELAWEN